MSILASWFWSSFSSGGGVKLWSNNAEPLFLMILGYQGELGRRSLTGACQTIAGRGEAPGTEWELRRRWSTWDRGASGSRRPLEHLGEDLMVDEDPRSTWGGDHGRGQSQVLLARNLWPMQMLGAPGWGDRGAPILSELNWLASLLFFPVKVLLLLGWIW
jgi:hypothetical protein